MGFRRLHPTMPKKMTISGGGRVMQRDVGDTPGRSLGRSFVRRAALALACAALSLSWPSGAKAELKLTEVGGWVVSTDGRVNAFVSHVWGDNRPKGLENLNWVGFNESNSPGQPDANDKLRKTRIRSGYVPSTFAMNFRKKVNDDFKLTTRVEIGIQITTIDPTWIMDPGWMEARSVYLDIAGRWGSVRAGRDMSLFPRSNLYMNYELGHGYGVGFPCAYEKMFGGACGHVGFGTLWPDYRAQMTYSTPNFGDVFQVSVGVFDPRTDSDLQLGQDTDSAHRGRSRGKLQLQRGLWDQSLGQRVLAAGRHDGRHESGSRSGGSHAREFHAERVRRGRRPPGKSRSRQGRLCRVHGSGHGRLRDLHLQPRLHDDHL